jgi:hypothetical protein
MVLGMKQVKNIALEMREYFQSGEMYCKGLSGKVHDSHT